MKKFLLSLLIGLISNLTIAQIDGNNLFDDSFLHEIRFENVDTNTYINTKNYQRLLMKVDGAVVDSVGFKRKGNISGYPSTNKFGIKIKTNKYVPGKKYDGIKEFTLHMNYQDPTMMREKLTYDICAEMGLYSLRTAFAKVYINNVYWGLFTLVEGKDEMYKQIFDYRDMDAIESLDFGNMCYISNNPADYDESQNGGNPTYMLENGNPATAWPNFATMIDKANNTSSGQYMSTVPNYLNLKDFFKYQAVNVYLLNFDSYIGFKGNQIYVYDTTAQLWQVTPWDFNASFGLWNTNNHTPTNYPILPTAVSNGCIASKMSSVSQLETYYYNAMCKLTNTVCDTTTMYNKIDQWKNQIQQAVYDDTRKVASNADFDNGVGYGYNQLFGENQPALKTFVRERFLLIEQGLSAINYSCPTVGLQEVTNTNQGIKLFPNPTNGVFNVDMNAISDRGDLELRIVSITGQEVLFSKNIKQGIDISHLENGVYIVIVSNEEKRYTERLIKY